MTRTSRFVFATLLTIGLSFHVHLPAQADTKCDELQFIFARGSGENLDDVSFEAWRTSIENTLSGLDLNYSFLELGAQTNSQYSYPAVAVAGSLSGIGNLVGAYISAGAAFDFGASVKEGINELVEHLENSSALCPQTKYILGGYSQGAMVNTRALPHLDSSKIIYVSNFGDPKTYLPEGRGRLPDACSGRNLSDYRAYVSDCYAYEGVLGSERPYQPSGYIGKLGLWCNNQDIMCSSGLSISDHTSYVSRGLYQNAATVISLKVRAAFPKIPTLEPTFTASAHDLIILFDTSGSMQWPSNLYRTRALALANEVRSLGGRVALVTYKHPKAENIRLACDFSCSAEEFTAALVSATQTLEGGISDGREPLLAALDFSMRSLEWQIGATKTIAVFTNGGMEYVELDRAPLEKIIQLSLSIDPVNIYTLVQYPSLIDEFAELTTRTSGKSYDLFTEADLMFSEIISRPSARLTLENYSGITGQEFYFDASSSIASENSKIVRYDWDLDCNGEFELQDADSAVSHRYTQPIDGYIQVKVTDDVGYSSTMSAKLAVLDQLPALAQVKITQVQVLKNGEYQINYQTDGSDVLVSLGDAVLGFAQPENESLIIKDVTKAATLTLTAYSANGKRGLSTQAVLDPDNDSSSNDSSGEPNSGNPSNDDSTDINPDSSNSTSADPDNDDSTNTNTDNSNPINPPSGNQSGCDFIPMAPNAGYFPSPATNTTKPSNIKSILGATTTINYVNSSANDRHIRNGIHLNLARHNHAVLPVPLLPLLLAYHNKFFVARPPNTS